MMSISASAQQPARGLRELEKEVGVFVDLDAINQLESAHPDEGGQQSPPSEPSENETLGEPRIEPLLALEKDQETIARTTKDRVEYLLALTDNICNQVRRGVAEPSIGGGPSRTR